MIKYFFHDIIYVDEYIPGLVCTIILITERLGLKHLLIKFSEKLKASRLAHVHTDWVFVRRSMFIQNTVRVHKHERLKIFC